MLTKQQIQELPIGSYTNTMLAKIFETHCKPLHGRRQFKFEAKEHPTTKEPIVISTIKNRKQRRAK